MAKMRYGAGRGSVRTTKCRHGRTPQSRVTSTSQFVHASLNNVAPLKGALVSCRKVHWGISKGTIDL
jgi:hypothetical protein